MSTGGFGQAAWSPCIFDLFSSPGQTALTRRFQSLLQIRSGCSTVGEIAGRQLQATLKESAKFCPVAVSAPLKMEDQEVWYTFWRAVPVF